MLSATEEFPFHRIIAAEGAAAPWVVPLEADRPIEPWVDLAGRDCGWCVEDGEAYRVCIYGVGSFAIPRTAGSVLGMPEPGGAPEAFEDIFRRCIVPFALQRRGREVLHASGLLVDGASVALCGDAEMGKSTLAYAWCRRGGRIFADDAILIRVDGSAASIHPLPFQVRLRPPSRQHFGIAAGDRHDPAAERRAGEPGRLRAIYLLDRRRAEAGAVGVEAIDPDEALPALLRQAYCLTLRDRERNRRMVANFMALANLIPVHRLSYPTGLSHVETILDRLAAHTASLPEAGCPSGQADP